MADDFDPYYTWLGIRPEEQPPDHYRLIGLKRFEDNADVIANATDRQMQFLRSMQVGKKSAQSQTLLNEISAAGGCLLDPQRKVKYDLELKAQEATKVQAAKAAAAKARPLPKATSLESPKPAKAPEAAPLPKSEVFSLQLTSGPTKPSASASSLTPAKPAPTHGLKSPAAIAAAVGGVLLLVVMISVAGWMFFRGDSKNVAAKPPSAKGPAANPPAKTPAANPGGTSDSRPRFRSSSKIASLPKSDQIPD